MDGAAAPRPGPAMRRIDNEARALLLQRRQALHRGHPDGNAIEVVLRDDAVAHGIVADKVVRELARIDEALGRIDQGRYGTCLSCGGPLGLQRIRAIPEARYCMGCSGQRLADD